MVYTNINSSFPDQVVPDEEKQSLDYGLQVARAIEGEWFSGYENARFANSYARFHNLKLYARGEQSIQKYKNELSINGDLSYLNLDWKPVPVIPKFVDILVNGMSQRDYKIKSFAQDPTSVQERTKYANSILNDIRNKQYIDAVKTNLNLNISEGPKGDNIPKTIDELPVHMQLDYKQSIEIAEEEIINNVLDSNRHDLIKSRVNYDLTVLGIGATKTGFNRSEGITIDYVDPTNLVWSYTEDPNFEDIWYVGEIKTLSLPELKKQFPHLTSDELSKIQKYPGNSSFARDWNGRNSDNTIQVLFFEYKTYANQVFKIKQGTSGLEKAIEKRDTFNPPESENFKKAFRAIEVLYSGAKIVGHETMLRWELARNMTRPNADTVKVNMSYSIAAPRMYKGNIESTVSRITSFADMIQITHLKLQQVLARMVPDGVYLDADGLAEVDLGNGTNYNPAEALNMYFQTGSIIGRSLTQDGDLNHAKIPIQELQSSGGQNKISALIQTYQYYLQMIRDVTGLNEARDGSVPDPDSLVGLQKLAAANSNTATRHILQTSLYLILKTCENISLRVADALLFPLTRMALEASISKYNVATLDELSSLRIHDFGIFLELEPDEEEKAMLEQNIQMCLQQQSIYLEDAIDIREIHNLKLANQVLKLRRKKKQQYDEQIQLQNIQAQAQANSEAAERAAMAEVQKQQAIAETTLQIEKGKSQFDIQKLQQEGQIKKQLMELEFQFNMQLTQAQSQAKRGEEEYKEKSKDERTRIQATQQSELIDQRKKDLAPKNFESVSNDQLTGNIGLGQFNPR